VTVHPGGSWLLAANYRGHNAVVFALDGQGRPGQLASSVAGGKHAHAIRLPPTTRSPSSPTWAATTSASTVSTCTRAP
jgi:hypothetical protein